MCPLTAPLKLQKFKERIQSFLNYPTLNMQALNRLQHKQYGDIYQKDYSHYRMANLHLSSFILLKNLQKPAAALTGRRITGAEQQRCGASA